MIPRAADGVIVTFIFCFHSLLLTIDRDSGDGPFCHDDIGRDNGCNIGDGSFRHHSNLLDDTFPAGIHQ